MRYTVKNIWFNQALPMKVAGQFGPTVLMNLLPQNVWKAVFDADLGFVKLTIQGSTPYILPLSEVRLMQLDSATPKADD